MRCYNAVNNTVTKQEITIMSTEEIKEYIKSIELVDFEELGMEAVRKIRVVNFPAFIIVDDKGKERYSMGKPQDIKSTKTKPKEQAKKDTNIKKPDDESHRLASEKQLKFIFSLAKQKKYTELIKGYVQLKYNKDNSAQLTSQEASEIIKYLQEMED